MLQVTNEAVTVLKETRNKAGAPDNIGVRLAKAPSRGEGEISLFFSEAPEENDQTIEQDELRVYVAEDLVEPLSERTLDVQATDEGAKLILR